MALEATFDHWKVVFLMRTDVWIWRRTVTNLTLKFRSRPNFNRPIGSLEQNHESFTRRQAYKGGVQVQLLNA